MLVFEADYSTKNNNGDTAWDIILKQFQSKAWNNLDKVCFWIFSALFIRKFCKKDIDIVR